MVSSPSSPDYSRPSPPKSPSRSRSKSKAPMAKNSWSDDGWEKGWQDGWEEWEGWGDDKEEKEWASTWKTRGRWEEEKWEDGGERRWRRDEHGKSLTSGSAHMRQRLQLLQEKQGLPKNKDEEYVQRLAAMGTSRFKRMMGRKEKQEKAEREKQEAFQQGAAYQQQLIWQQQQQWQQHQWPQGWSQQWPQQWPAQGGITLMLFFCFQICMYTFFCGRWLWIWCQPSSCIPASKPQRPGHESVHCSVHTSYLFCAMPIQFILFWAGAAQASEPNAAGLSGFLIVPFFNCQVYFPYFSARTAQGSEEWPWERASKRPWERAGKRP